MGRNVSLCLITPRAAADSLLRKFSGILDDAGRRRLGSCRWMPESEMALQLFPGQGYLNIPNDSMSSADDHHQFSVDRMTEFLLSTNSG